MKNDKNIIWDAVTGRIKFSGGEGDSSIIQKQSNAAAFGKSSSAFGVSSTNAEDRGITQETPDGEIAEIWASLGDDKFALAKGEASHIEGNNCLALGKNSHAEGNGTVASNSSAHAEGTGAMATGKHSHAEGLETKASGDESHAEGRETQATQHRAHAEGWASVAQGDGSHCEGVDTIAYNYAEHAEGEGNASHTGETAADKTRHSVGIGTENARINAFEIMQNGDAYLYGVGNYDGTNPSSATPINQLIGQGGGSTLQIIGTFDRDNSEFTCTSGHSLDNIKNALLAGTPVIVDVVVNYSGETTRYITSDIAMFYDSGVWYAFSKTFHDGVIDSWVVQS